MSDDLVKRLRCWPQSVAGDTMKDAADRIEALEARVARQSCELKKLWIALTTYENKVQEYASDDWARSDHAYDWLNDDAGKIARDAILALLPDTDALAARDARVRAEALREAADKLGNLHDGFTYRPRDMKRHVLQMIDRTAEGDT